MIYSCGPYISYHDQTTKSLEFYKQAIHPNERDSFLIISKGEIIIKGQTKNVGRKNPRKTSLTKNITNLQEMFKEVNDSTKTLFKNYFENNSCKCGSEKMYVFVRKIFAPQSFYSHLATPYRSASFVFYVFTDYDAETGLGRYYQTDAYFPRDAFSFDIQDLCPDACFNQKRIEFFTGIFFLSHSELIDQDVIALLGPLNDINDRKEFTIERSPENKLKFIKSFEFKMYNYYPIVQGNYVLEQQVSLPCEGENTKKYFENEYAKFDSLDEHDAAMTLINQNTTIDSINRSYYRDYFYPLRGVHNGEADSGYVFFGELKNNKNVKNETFYRFKTMFGTFNHNKEIKCLKTLEKMKKCGYSLKPFDVIKVHNKIVKVTNGNFSNFNDSSIVGEARPNCLYRILEINKVENLKDSIIWLKVSKANQVRL